MRTVFIIILIAVLLIALFLVKSRCTKLSGQSDRLSAVLLYLILPESRRQQEKISITAEIMYNYVVGTKIV